MKQFAMGLWAIWMLVGCGNAASQEVNTASPDDVPESSATGGPNTVLTSARTPSATQHNIPTLIQTVPPFPPDLLLLLPDGITQDMLQGSLCWPTLGCGDGPPPVIEEFSVIGADRMIRLKFAPGPIPDRVFLALYGAPWNPETDTEAEASAEFVLSNEFFQWGLDVPPGDYVLSGIAEWQTALKADVRYWYGVSIP